MEQTTEATQGGGGFGASVHTTLGGANTFQCREVAIPELLGDAADHVYEEERPGPRPARQGEALTSTEVGFAIGRTGLEPQLCFRCPASFSLLVSKRVGVKVTANARGRVWRLHSTWLSFKTNP